MLIEKVKKTIDLEIVFLAFIIPSTISFLSFISIPMAIGQSDLSTYTDPQGRFSISYPSDWQPSMMDASMSSGGTMPILSFISTHGTNLNIITIPFRINTDPSLPLNNFAMGAQRILEDPSIEQNIECSNYIVGGHKACSIVIEGSKFGIPMESLIVNTVVNGVGYFFTFTDDANNFNSNLPTFESMLSSFQASPSTGSMTINPQSPSTSSTFSKTHTADGFKCNDPSDVSCYPSNIPSDTLQQMESAQEQSSQSIIDDMN